MICHRAASRDALQLGIEGQRFLAEHVREHFGGVLVADAEELHDLAGAMKVRIPCGP
jgi:hypothetical protein